jgi:hypothetical protein
LLSGERTPNTILDRVSDAAVLLMYASPFPMMGGAMTWVGLLAIGPRKDIRELWICLPGGLALLGFFGALVYWIAWRIPRLTVTRFAYDGVQLALEVPARGRFARTADELQTVVEKRSRHRLLGWWLKFEGSGAVFLNAETPNAAELVQLLGPRPSSNNLDS